VAGTIYEAIHCAVLPNFLLLPAIKVQQLLSTTTVPTVLECHRPSVTPTFMKILNTHTVYISIFMFSESKKESKTLWSCS